MAHWILWRRWHWSKSDIKIQRQQPKLSNFIAFVSYLAYNLVAFMTKDNRMPLGLLLVELKLGFHWSICNPHIYRSRRSSWRRASWPISVPNHVINCWRWCENTTALPPVATCWLVVCRRTLHTHDQAHKYFMVSPKKKQRTYGDKEDQSKFSFGDWGSHCLGAWAVSHSSCSLPAIIENQTTSKVTRTALLTKLEPTSKTISLVC